MKVVISTRAIYPFHGYGGMERYYYNLAKHLVEQGIKVEIVTSQDKSGNKFLEFDGIKYTFIPPNFNKKPFMSLWYYPFSLNVKKYLEKIRFDVLHGTAGTYPYSNLRNRKPVIVQPFGLEPFKIEGIRGLLLKILFYRMSKRNMENADAIASEGELQTKEIIDLFGVPREKIFYLPVGVDLDIIEQYLKNSQLSKEDYNLQDADLVLINVNRLAPNKGVPYLIESLKILNEELNVKLIMVGSGPEEGNIKKKINDLELQDKVLHFKNISDEKMFQLFTLADVSVTPTLYEGLPTVVLEAMACGKPIVASNVSEIPQVVKDGVNGFLVPPANSKAIADAVLKIYDKNLFMKMSKASKKIIKNYDWSKIAKMAVKKYEELLKWTGRNGTPSGE